MDRPVGFLLTVNPAVGTPKSALAAQPGSCGSGSESRFLVPTSPRKGGYGSKLQQVALAWPPTTKPAFAWSPPVTVWSSEASRSNVRREDKARDKATGEFTARRAGAALGRQHPAKAEKCSSTPRAASTRFPRKPNCWSLATWRSKTAFEAHLARIGLKGSAERTGGKADRTLAGQLDALSDAAVKALRRTNPCCCRSGRPAGR
jgi:hypothetical protein